MENQPSNPGGILESLNEIDRIMEEVEGPPPRKIQDLSVLVSDTISPKDNA